MTDTIDRSVPKAADAGESEVEDGAARPRNGFGRWALIGAVLVLTIASIVAIVVRGRGNDSPDVSATGPSSVTTVPSPSTNAGAPDHAMDHSVTPMTNVPGAGNPVSHDHGVGTYVPLDSATQKAFSAEMAQAREATMRYPTVADAKKAGLRPVGKFSAGSGAHYMVANPTTRLAFNPSDPLMWLFAGNDDTSPVVGLMYFSIAPTAPEGFTGPNDHWHQHTGLCLTYGPEGIGLPLPIDQDATPEQCSVVHGQFMASTGYMIHVWSAPGWESPTGVFSHDNELLVCADGRKAGQVQLNEGCEGLA